MRLPAKRVLQIPDFALQIPDSLLQKTDVTHIRATNSGHVADRLLIGYTRPFIPGM